MYSRFAYSRLVYSRLIPKSTDDIKPPAQQQQATTADQSPLLVGVNVGRLMTHN